MSLCRRASQVNLYYNFRYYNPPSCGKIWSTHCTCSKISASNAKHTKQARMCLHLKL
uniref:Uncharacterized protein n=1 Tax=Arundo donax TaxID=35708 RepID=A0A0A9A779_ARUDO